MTDTFTFSFNEFSETINPYPFYTGFNCGIVIDFRMKEDSKGIKDLLDTHVVTSGLPIESVKETTEFLRELADELDELYDDSVEQL